MSEERKRSLENDMEEEEEELDEFGRVIRRRAKFKKEKPDEATIDSNTRPEISEIDGREDRHTYRSRRHSRHKSRSLSRSRSRSRSRSPRRSRHRYPSDSDDDYDYRHHSSHRYRRRRSSGAGHRYYHRPYYHNSSSRGADVYSEAAQYLDTEFYATKIYVGELKDVTESDLKSIFARFGPLESVRLVEGKDYGFITYERKESALAAIQNMNGALVGSGHIKVNRAKIPERNKVGFGNVPWQDEDGLLAQEAGYDNHTLRPTTSASLAPSVPPVDATIPQRSLTTYDDL
ncbi:hypothetical protein BDF20DRAFT_151027 [Mycotypha africana]|uniref:uncharacterized protein n=1 Tax=Mycotypha africana TaxID=64632 RepID=UPI0023004283|nr:uncharacterized protein BDF20DRAFT_151027 [Mycotypha africana]KAI8969210.1 hypothetical protein BDF20DRAFT_151027 [Mycotypha africana]